jgi:TolB protein
MMKFHVLLIISFFISAYSKAQNSLKNWKIAYNVHYDTAVGNYEIFVMNTDGTEKKNISNSKGIDWVYYAYGDKLYFVSDRDTTYRKYQLFEMDAQGNNVRKISDMILDDSYIGAWKKGDELVVTSRQGGKRVFYLIDKNGKELARITPPGLEYFNDPMLLPTGEIVFRGAVKSNFKIRNNNNPDTNDELYSMNRDASGLRKLTNYPASDTTVEWFSYHSGPPRWNSAGKFVSYLSFQNGKHELFAVKPDQSVGVKILDHDLEAGWHDWTPDGKWLTLDMSKESRYDIYLIDWTTKKTIRLTDDWRTEQGPVFVKTKK